MKFSKILSAVVPALLITMLIPCSRTQAQQGTIYWSDGTVTEVDSFTDISVELVYHWWNRHEADNDKGKYFRQIPVSELNEIDFIRQRSEGTGGFYYRVIITGTDTSDQPLEETVKTWDWIDMQLPVDSGSPKTRVTFFHQKRRVKIDKILFK